MSPTVARRVVWVVIGTLLVGLSVAWAAASLLRTHDTELDKLRRAYHRCVDTASNPDVCEGLAELIRIKETAGNLPLP